MLRRWLGVVGVLTLALCSLPYAASQAAPIGYNTGTMGVAQATVVVQLVNHAACTALLGSGLTGTEIFEVSTDGNTWMAVTSFPDPGTSVGGVQSVTNPAGGSYQSNVAGYTYYRVRVSSYGSGSNTVTVSCTNGPMAAAQESATVSGTVAVSSLPPPVQPSPIYTIPVTTPGPYASAVVFDVSGNALTPMAQSTSSAQPIQTTLPANAYLYGMNAAKTGWFPFGNAGGAAGGSLAIQQCPASGIAANCVNPTASPNGDVSANSHPVVPMAPCANNAGTMNCAAVNASQQLSVTSPAPYATAVSPNPAGVLAAGVSAAGATSPVVCNHTISISLITTQATETVLVASAAGKVVYVCSVTAGVAGTAVGFADLAGSITNTCGAAAGTVWSSIMPNGSVAPGVGTGVGTIGQTTAGQALCFFDSGTPTNVQLTIMYEQFFRALSQREIIARCDSYAKRCALYGLFKHLYRLLDRVESPL